MADEYAIDKKLLFQRVRTHSVSKGKALLTYVGVEYLGKRNEEMAELTRISGAAASKAKVRGEGLFERSQLARWLKVN